ncbi:GTPase-associated protein 1-related protein [Nocardiopsis listeri]|uniref:GTPase-associated protein 1-related protein n=1 Tax=Nocardiopsis listeri TaxID=53440 RepID=UPI0008346B3B|nr:GTPase-associated protein 1-related protein [Nocardiopsis listeri]
MGAAQLYYTSCERGLSGCGGYQFNAATPGVDTRVLREVERFTVYEPPRSMPAEEAHRHPVNLCYSPDLGGARVLSRVVSSGHDPSGRPGNYFAHSLLLDGEEGPLPAELWGAGFWTGRPVSDPDLPWLSLVAGPLDRERTAAWLRGRDEALLSRLLVAVDAAIDGGAPVLLPARDEDAAHWVAALSHLLPPRRARRMSFATYSGSPEDAPVHVVAVPPETDTCGLRDRFVVFGASGLGAGDFAAQEVGGPETTPDTLSVVSTVLLTGVKLAPRLWASAGLYASGSEEGLSTWRPPLAAARLSDARVPVTEPDLRVIRAWLPEVVGRLPGGPARELLGRLLDPSLERADDEPARLQTVAHACGSWELIERAEGLLVRHSLARIASGAPAPPVATIRSPRMSSMARDRVAALLDGALEPTRVVELLRWIRAGGVCPPEAALERYGAGPLARALADVPPGRELVELLAAHAPLRRGVARALGSLPCRTLAVLAADPIGAFFAADREVSPSVSVLRELRVLLTGTDTGPPATRALADCPEALFDAYRRMAAECLALPPRSILGLSARPLEAGLVARVFLIARRLCEQDPETAIDRGRSLLLDVLEPAALTWSRRDVAAARRAFHDPGRKRDFDRWMRGVRERDTADGLFGLRFGGNR